MAQPTAQTDRDLTSISEARSLVRRAKEAAPVLAELSQEQIDAMVDAMAAAVTPQAEALARLACEETGYGVVADKIQKNLFSSQKIYNFIRPMKTVGVIARLEDRKVIEIAEPFGVVAAIVPSTNPTSTAIYKILISIKARCPIVISPHPSAVRCITRVAEIMNEAARRAGAPDGAINWMTTVTLEGTQELMKARETAVILATGGMGLVRAAYSAGKPAYGVGPGNAPAYIESSADVVKAVRDIVTGKTFDNGLLCSSENSVVCDAALVQEVKRQFVANGAHFLSPAEIDAVGRLLVTPQRLPNPKLVGRPATYIAQQAGISVPSSTTCTHRGARGCWPRLPALDRKAVPGALLLCRQRLAGRMRTLQADPAVRRHGTHDVDPFAERRHHPAVRPQEACLPHCGEHADDARLYRFDDGAGPVHDARLWRLRWEHHVGQHLAATSPEYQAARLRNQPGAGAPRGRGACASRRAAEGASRAASTGWNSRGTARTANRPVPRISGVYTAGSFSCPGPGTIRNVKSRVGGKTGISGVSRKPEPGKTCRVRLRRRCSAGGEAGTQDRNRRTNNRYSSGAGPR